MIDVSKLARPATEGPWLVVHDSHAVRIRPLYDGLKLVVVDVGEPGAVELDQDAEAIAALPALWEAVDERDAEIARLREALEDIRDREWVENVLNPQWAALRAREAIGEP